MYFTDSEISIIDFAYKNIDLNLLVAILKQCYENVRWF